MLRNQMLRTIICNYGSEDHIEEVIKEYPHITLLSVKPNEGQFINICKCFNKAVGFTTNPIIAPLGIDCFFEQHVIESTINMFRSLGAVILRLEVLYVDAEGKVYNRANPAYALLRPTILDIGGWDERMYNWGKDEDDLIWRIRKKMGLIQVSVKGFGYLHRWHERGFSKKEEVLQGHNFEIFQDNIANDAKNLVNSYWKK